MYTFGVTAVLAADFSCFSPRDFGACTRFFFFFVCGASSCETSGSGSKYIPLCSQHNKQPLDINIETEYCLYLVYSSSGKSGKKMQRFPCHMSRCGSHGVH